MSYTEQDVERVAEAMWEAGPQYRSLEWHTAKFYAKNPQNEGTALEVRDTYKQARAALEAMEREPQPFPSMVGDRDALRELIYDDPILTDDQKREVYRIAEAIRVRVRSNYPELWDIGDRPDAWAYPARILLGMVPQPLEDVLDAIGGYVSEVGRNPGHTDGWQAVVVKEPYQHFGTGATIDEAIRNAVASAKGEKA